MEPPRCPSPPREPQIPGNRPQKPARNTQVRNRRYAAMRELIREGDYFSEERMRLRAPRLFHRYIGRFRDIPKKNPAGIPQNPPGIPQNPPGIPQNAQKGPEMPQKAPKLPQKEPGRGAGPARELRELLLSALEESAGAEDEEDEEEEEEEEEEEGRERVPDAAERELLRLEFTSHMYQRFLQGLDSDFDYSAVDQDPWREPLELSRDLEDRYFDEEEPGPAPPLL